MSGVGVTFGEVSVAELGMGPNDWVWHAAKGRNCAGNLVLVVVERLLQQSRDCLSPVLEKMHHYRSRV